MKNFSDLIEASDREIDDEMIYPSGKCKIIVIPIQSKMLHEGWCFQTNITNEETVKILAKYEKKYGKDNVQIINGAYDFAGRLKPDLKALYVRREALKSL